MIGWEIEDFGKKLHKFVELIENPNPLNRFSVDLEAHGRLDTTSSIAVTKAGNVGKYRKEFEATCCKIRW